MQFANSRGGRKPILYSEYVLFIHTIMTYLLSSSGSLVWYLNYFSVFSAGMLFWELGIRKGWRPGSEWMPVFLPLILLAGMTVIAVFFDPITKQFGFKVIYAYTLAFMYYCLVLATGRIWFLVWGLFVSLGVIFISQGLGAAAVVMDMGTRGEVSSGGDRLNVNSYAMICLMCIAFALYQFFGAKIEIRRRLYRALTQVICVGVVLVALHQIMIVTGSRKGMVFVCYWLAIASLMWMRGRITVGRVVAAGLIGAVLLVVGLIGLYFSPFFWRIEEIYYGLTGQYTNEMSFIIRSEFIQAGIGYWLESPIWGDYCRFWKEYGTYSHSNPIELLVNHGIIGCALYYSYYAIYAKQLFWPCFRSGLPAFRSTAIFVGSFLLMFFLWEFGAVNYYERYTWPVIGALLGMSVCSLRQLHSPQSSQMR